MAAGRLVLAKCLLLAGAGSASAELLRYTVELRGANEAPPNDSPGNGTALVTFDTESRALTWSVEHAGLTGPVTGMHFYGPTDPGRNAGIVLHIRDSLDSPVTGSATLTPAQPRRRRATRPLRPADGPGVNGPPRTADTLLAVESLVVRAGGGAPAVDGVSFAVSRGEILAVVGESGSGKTATVNAVIGLLPSGLALASGAIRFEGEDLARARPERLRRLRGPGMGMVFQEPMVSLNPALSIGAQLAEGLALHERLRAAVIRVRSVAMLTRVGIAEPESCLLAFRHEFSGGMHQCIMLASVMLLRPRLLIADEPTMALDTLTQAEVLDLVVELTREKRHRRAPDHAQPRARGALRRSGPRDGGRPDRGAGRRQGPAGRTARALYPRPRRRPASPRSAPAAGALLLAAENLVVLFGGRRRFLATTRAVRVVDGVDLVVPEGEAVALVGGSGSGKTTLGRAVLRLVDPAAGRILFRGEDVTTKRGPDLLPFRLSCQIVFQDSSSSLDPRMRVHAILSEPLRLLPGLDARDKARRADAMPDEVGLAGYGRRFPHELSGGQRQRVAIARALARSRAIPPSSSPTSRSPRST